ncbi:MAG TPA: hypothetical protein PKY59_01545 [Pyrinomonadaceae bacterium]|nr:hypothetical protein [Pyrinomonadaceae bacterium]
MDLIKFYRFSLFLPIIVPLLISPAMLFLPTMSHNLGLIVLFVVYSVLAGGIPYLILAIPLFFRMRNKTENHIRKRLLLMPVGMIAIFAIFALAAFIGSLFSADRNTFATFKGGLESLLFVSLFTLIFGYFYIGLTFGILWLLKRSGRIKQTILQ